MKNTTNSVHVGRGFLVYQFALRVSVGPVLDAVLDYESLTQSDRGVSLIPRMNVRLTPQIGLTKG